MADVVIHPVSSERFPDLVELFGTRGDPSWCWCQYFLTTGRGYERSAGDNRLALRRQVAAAMRPVGLVAYAALPGPSDPGGASPGGEARCETGGETSPGPSRESGRERRQAVGWVQLGPRPTFPRITGNPAYGRVVAEGDDDLHDPDVWAVTCFVVKVGHRRRGIGRALLTAAVETARDHGARAIVAHPVDVAERRGKVSGSELYHGAASTFASAGFRVVGRTGTTRPVMRLEL